MMLWQSFCYALSFLTRIPCSISAQYNPQSMRHSLKFYPFVGLIIGALLVIVLQLLFWSYGSKPDLYAVFALVILFFWVLITGGLHLDGLADSADAWVGGQQDRLRTLKIMQDPHIGVIGMLALLLVLLGKWVALSVLLKQHALWVVSLLLLGVPMLARMSMLILLASLPYVRSNGLGSMLKEGANHVVVLANLVWVLLFSVVLLQQYVLPLLGFAVAWWVLSYLMLKQRLAGCTGDTLGAHLEIQEVIMLLALALNTY